MVQRGNLLSISFLVVCFLLASPFAGTAAENAGSTTSCAPVAPPLCSDSLLLPLAQSPVPAEPQPLAVCPCLEGNSVDCWGGGDSCSSAYSAFASDCHSQAAAACYPDAKCKVVIGSWSCQASGGGYIVDGSASFGCRYCF